MKRFRKSFIVAISIPALIVFGAALYFYHPYFFSRDSTSEVDHTITEVGGDCLSKSEKVEYDLESWGGGTTNATIIISEPDNNKSRSFVVDNIRTSYHPVDIHACGVYFVKEFGVDYTTTTFLPNFKWTIWKYDYKGHGVPILTLAEKQNDKVVHYYSTDFRIDPDERFLVLEKGFAGSSEGIYDIVFKNLRTMEDVFIFPVLEVWENYPETIFGSSVGFDQGWTKDGRYFWANFFGGAPVYAYIRIDTKDWSYGLFPAPPDVLGGDQLNIETGWVTVHPGNVWYGIHELAQEEFEKRYAEGTGTELYIHNLFTGENRLVASIPEPLWYFRPKWISDTELEYQLPTDEYAERGFEAENPFGEKRTYIIQ